MANINKIKLSGTTYNIQDLSAAKSVELTQAQYDALVTGGTVDPNTFYIITDAQGADLSQYYTSAQTESAITQAVSGKVDTSTFNTYSGSVDTALSGKQDTLVSGTNIKTINNESILGSGNITIQGGGGTSYTAGTGIDITNDVISVTGMVDTATFNTYSGSVDTALSGKQDTLSAGTGIEISGNVISATGGGGSITIDPSLDSGSTNAVANSAITQNFYNYAKFVGYANQGYVVSISSRDSGNAIAIDGSKIKTGANGSTQNSTTSWLYTSTINGKKAVSSSSSNTKDFSLVETSAITSSITSSSTDAQVPSAKAVYDQLGGMKIVKLTESEYTALVTKDDDTLYCVVPDPSN